MNVDYVAYLESVLNRLKSDGFEVESNVKVGELDLDLLASRVWGLSGTEVVCSLKFFPKADGPTLSAYISRIHSKGVEYEHQKVKIHGLESEGRTSLSVFPVAASTSFDEETKRRIQTEKGFRLTSFTPFAVGTHVSATTGTATTHPVLAELQSRQIFHHTKLSFVGLTTQLGTRRFAASHFNFP